MEVPTGTLIGAALETVGYHSQATVLAGLTQMFFEIGTLFYLFALLAAATVYVFTSSVRQALWLIVGPGLFYFLIFFRVQAPGAVWVFGTFDDARDGFNSLPDVVSFDEDAEVSWFFNRWNILVSNVYNELVKVITSHDSFRAHVRFMTRARLSDIVFRSDIQDPGLQALVAHGLSSNCADAMNAMRDIAYARANPTYAYSSPTLQHSFATLPALYAGQRFAFPQNSPARIYLVNLLARLTSMTTDRDLLINALCEGSAEATDALAAFQSGTDYESAITAISCRQAWCWTALGTYFEALRLAELAECKYTPRLLHMCSESDLLHNGLDAQRTEIMKEIWSDIALKLLSPELAEQSGFTVDLHYVPIMLTGALLRKILTVDPRTYLPTEYASSSDYHTGSSAFDMAAIRTRDLESSRTLDARHELASSLRYESFIFASRIPYVQGGILFGLSVLFPFFALFVLIPGKARTMITWMSLWAWVKSWDLGYAMVMVADDVLWSLIPYHSQYQELLSGQNGPLALLEGAFRSDPSYSISTYYMLLAAMIMAVPMVTAQFILGMQSAIAGVMMGRMYGLGSRLQENQTVLARRRMDNAQQSQSQQSLPSQSGTSQSAGDTSQSSSSPQTGQLNTPGSAPSLASRAVGQPSGGIDTQQGGRTSGAPSPSRPQASLPGTPRPSPGSYQSQAQAQSQRPAAQSPSSPSSDQQKLTDASPVIPPSGWNDR